MWGLTKSLITLGSKGFLQEQSLAEGNRSTVRAYQSSCIMCFKMWCANGAKDVNDDVSWWCRQSEVHQSLKCYLQVTPYTAEVVHFDVLVVS